MSEFIFNNSQQYNTPHYKFDNASTQIKSAIQSEIISRGKAQLFTTINDLKKVKLSKSQEYKFSNVNTSSTLPVEHIYNLTFLATPYINQFGEKANTPELKIEICSIGLSFSKTEVRTELINQSGTIKEIVSHPDTSVNVSGVLIGSFTPPSSTSPLAGMPLNDMKNLKTIAEANISVKVISDYLSQFGIDRISINNLQMGQELEWKNIQRFSFTALSDDENLIIN